MIHRVIDDINLSPVDDESNVKFESGTPMESTSLQKAVIIKLHVLLHTRNIKIVKINMNSIGHSITSTCIDKIAEKQSFLFFMTSTIQAPINPKHQFVLKKERETVNVHVIH